MFQSRHCGKAKISANVHLQVGEDELMHILFNM